MPIHGTCGFCGGAVTTPNAWHGVNPPTPECVSCGAVPKQAFGPVIDMKHKTTSYYVGSPISPTDWWGPG